ncbi:unnamed protein product (macronuclear) [Paramecium tetraurelia]|uniref:Uncharacterized protein n=1 Tax=Paramecium tetraurelia TaxID=5888 RepID=A0CFC1_PARTE|nr:uncharacterized protein GSPATT00037927001 [Paramecium tetraurelia]CAK69488.1 unnamed protein product [Paramecium tetraurelia]|eukprot:XP_001436885.1 hypothetical protein (macronuclear) [Paramecium tetraurelia strain d4-2]
MYKNDQLLIKAQSKDNSPSFKLKLPQLTKSPYIKQNNYIPSQRSKNQSPFQKQSSKGRSISNKISNNSLEVSTHISTQERIKTNNFNKKSILQIDSLMDKFSMHAGFDQQYKYLDQLEKQSSILVHNYLQIHQQMINQRNRIHYLKK